MSDNDRAPRLIIDLNHILNGSLLGGKDPDAIISVVDGKTETVNSARYGVDKFFDVFTGVLQQFDTAPRDVIGVWDGKNAKAYRQTILPGYKASTRTDSQYEQLNAAREMVSQMLHDMGAHTVKCEGTEADDVISYLVARMRERKNIVVTGDGDLTVLVDENTHVFRQGKLDENPYGPFPHQYITLYKALVGDTSDKIPGAKGFGDAAFVKLVSKFGLDGLELMENLVRRKRLHELEEDVAELPVLKKILENQEQVYASWGAARLYPDRVNTLRRPLEWRAGMVKQWNDLDETARVQALKKFYGTSTLVHAGNYEKIKTLLAPRLQTSPAVALDIETSVPEEALDWLEQTRSKGGKGVSVDVLGSTLTGMSLTFGDNLQHTVYVTVDHREADGVVNVTSEQAQQLVELIPQTTHIVIQNRAFEFVVLHNEWAHLQKDNGWLGFIPNAIDTKVGASYVDENFSTGLKQRSKAHLGYEQQTYEETTTMSGPLGSLPEGGTCLEQFEHVLVPAVTEERPVLKKGEQVYENDENGFPVPKMKTHVVTPAVTETWETRQYQMNELTAVQVFGYGCDDTITTGALHTWYRIVMEMEGTWQTYLEVEQLPEYLTSLAFVQGIPVDLGKLRQMEKEDRKALAENEAILEKFLIDNGWEGTVLPQYEELTPANVKEAINLVLGAPAGEEEFTTRKRKLEAIAEDVRAAYPDNETAELLASAISQSEVGIVNSLLERNFDGKPKINFGSPKQMQHLLYNVIKITPRVFNKLTDKERADEDFRKAFYAKKEYLEGTLGREPTEYERSVWLKKVSTDDDSVQVALFRDNLTDEQKQVLESYLKIKEIETRISLFYNVYTVMPHWKTGLIHSAMNQCQAVTRRYSSSGPNLQQLPSRGEGVKFRTLLPAPEGWVYVSLDFNGQELRLMAELSQDENMLSCYIGENKRDIHSLIAVEASSFLWDERVEYEDFMSQRKSDDDEVSQRAKDLRDSSKTVNFATQYGAQATNISIQLKSEEDIAQKFIDAKDAAFPGVNVWKDKVEGEVADTGLAFTMLGVPRHLRESVLSPNAWVRSKAARQGPNFMIQGSGAEMAKLAMARMWSDGMFTGALQARFVAPVHDEVVFLVKVEDAVEAARRAHKHMTAPYADMKVPIVSAISIGKDFSCPVEVGDEFDEEKVRAALEELTNK